MDSSHDPRPPMIIVVHSPVPKIKNIFNIYGIQIAYNIGLFSAYPALLFNDKKRQLNENDQSKPPSHLQQLTWNDRSRATTLTVSSLPGSGMIGSLHTLHLGANFLQFDINLFDIVFRNIMISIEVKSLSRFCKSIFIMDDKTKRLTYGNHRYNGSDLKHQQ